MPSNLSETICTLKCFSLPLGTLCMWLSQATSRCLGWKIKITRLPFNFFQRLFSQNITSKLFVNFSRIFVPIGPRLVDSWFNITVESPRQTVRSINLKKCTFPYSRRRKIMAKKYGLSIFKRSIFTSFF